MGSYRGARYSRTWLTTLALLPVLSGVYFAVLGGSSAWIVLVPLAVVIVAVVWSVPLSIVGPDGIRLVLLGRTVRWTDITAVLDPRPGDEEVRVQIDGDHLVRLPGVPPEAAPTIRALHAARRTG
jgi:hypothetical protein